MVSLNPLKWIKKKEEIVVAETETEVRTATVTGASISTIELNKVRVVEPIPKMFAITLKLKCMDGETELINRDFTINHKIGNSIDYSIDKFKDQMQDEIEKYKREQQILNAQILDTAIETLKGKLVI